MANAPKNRSLNLGDLVEMLEGEGIAISLVARSRGTEVGATAGDATEFPPQLITWAKLARMRRAADWADHLEDRRG